MNHYLLKKGSEELDAFPHIAEFALKKNSTIEFDSLKKVTSECLRIYYVTEGRFDWLIEDQHYILYPGHVAIILPDQSFGGEKELLDIGTVGWMHIELEQVQRNAMVEMGKWSRLSGSECRTIGKILLLN